MKSESFRQRYGKFVPKVIEGLPRRSLSEMQGIWRNLLPHLAGRADHSISPLALQLRNAIVVEWSLRARIAKLDPESFPWPSTDAPGGDGRIETNSWRPEGMLTFLGYHVGATKGLAARSRRAILDAAFLCALPPLNGPNYMREWGEPDSGPRLRKIAESLAAFSRNAARRRHSGFDVAISEWESDLKYLHSQYYSGRFGFPWPVDIRQIE